MAYWKSIAAEREPSVYADWKAPRLKADERDLFAVEKSIGKMIPIEYFDFLRTADGWTEFFISTDLLSSVELLSGSHGQDVLEYFFENHAIKANDFLVIGEAKEDIDVILLVLAPSDEFNTGNTIWVRGDVVEVYENFTEYFGSMVNLFAELVNELDGAE